MLAILADDLTGALDSAAPFAGRGLRTEVALDADAVSAIVADRPDVISINLACREVSADEAARLTAEAVALLAPGTTLFKKVDSRLKGNIAAELDAIRDVIAFARALVVPAIPEFGRIVDQGCVTGFGVDQPIPVSDRLEHHAGRAIIPDTRTTAEIDAALETAAGDGTDLFVGARGLAEALARRLTGRADAALSTLPADATRSDPDAGRATFVIGSRDPITLAQIDDLRTRRPLAYLAAPNGDIPRDVPRDGPAGLPAESGITLVQATPGRSDASPLAVAEALAAGLQARLSRGGGTLLLSGGATAEQILRRLGVSRLTLLGECLPGLGLAMADGRCIIAKSGGFGSPGTLTEIADMILRKAG